jgi:hypothetical protein
MVDASLVERRPMVRRLFRRRQPDNLRYYLYLSTTKVQMLYPQIPKGVLRSLEAEVRANVGVVQATVRGVPQPIDPDRYAQAEVVASYLAKYDQIGTIAEPARYVRDVAPLRHGVVWEYAADIAFFGGRVGTTRVALIGSSDSMVGEPERAEARHAPFYYTLKFLRRIVEAEQTDPPANPPYASYAEAFEIALNATTSPETNVEFMGRLLHQESDLIVVTPIYVALAD